MHNKSRNVNKKIKINKLGAFQTHDDFKISIAFELDTPY